MFCFAQPSLAKLRPMGRARPGAVGLSSYQCYGYNYDSYPYCHSYCYYYYH